MLRLTLSLTAARTIKFAHEVRVLNARDDHNHLLNLWSLAGMKEVLKYIKTYSVESMESACSGYFSPTLGFTSVLRMFSLVDWWTYKEQTRVTHKPVLQHISDMVSRELGGDVKERKKQGKNK